VTIERQIADAVRDALADELGAIRTELGELRTSLERGPGAERLMTRAETATWAACSVRVVDGWLAAGAPCIRLGGPGGSPRMRASELLMWLRERSSSLVHGAGVTSRAADAAE
jgi:hypothetical protein